MIDIDGQLLLVGAGRMGSAMLAGWLEAGLKPEQILVMEPRPSEDLLFLMEQQGIAFVQFEDIKMSPQVVVLAVKPQFMGEVTKPLSMLFSQDTLIISVAAGQTVASLEGHLGEGRPIVRVMPNTPAAIGRGMSVAFASAEVSGTQAKICTALMRAVGDVAWVEEEGLMDAVTAVSGSGPAYIFLLAEVMAAAGQKAGLPDDLARQLADSTVAGSGELLRRSHEEAAILRKNVTSPGGTTEAALKVLMADSGGMKELMEKAVNAAVRRSKELS